MIIIVVIFFNLVHVLCLGFFPSVLCLWVLLLFFPPPAVIFGSSLASTHILKKQNFLNRKQKKLLSPYFRNAFWISLHKRTFFWRGAPWGFSGTTKALLIPLLIRKSSCLSVGWEKLSISRLCRKLILQRAFLFIYLFLGTD